MRKIIKILSGTISSILIITGVISRDPHYFIAAGIFYTAERIENNKTED